MNPAQVQAAMSQAVTVWANLISTVGVDSEFRLRDGTRFTIKTVRRRKPDEPLTDGIHQKGFEIQFMARDWSAAAPPGVRPEKGDQVVMVGRRYAIETSKLTQYGTLEIGYVCRVLG
jgi:hypothetical protein